MTLSKAKEMGELPRATAYAVPSEKSVCQLAYRLPDQRWDKWFLTSAHTWDVMLISWEK